MTRNGDLVAAAGWAHARAGVIYVIDPHRSAITSAISVGSIGADCLSLSPNGRYLAAGLGTAGLRVFDRNRQWGETFRDTSYLRGVFGIEFADDDRLFVACKDGTIRVYDRNFKRISLGRTAISGREPEGFAVSPDGSKLALAYRDAAAVDVFDGLSLTRLSRPKVEGFGSEGHITRVAWSKDGNTLFAGGGYQEKLGCCIYAWKGAGRGERRALRAGFSNTVAGLAVMPDGDLLVATQDPFLAVVRDDGSTGWERYPRMPDFRAQYDTLGVASNGMVLDFGFGYAGETPLRFDLNARSLSPGAVSRWRDNPSKTNRTCGKPPASPPLTASESGGHWRMGKRVSSDPGRKANLSSPGRMFSLLGCSPERKLLCARNRLVSASLQCQREATVATRYSKCCLCRQYLR